MLQYQALYSTVITAGVKVHAPSIAIQASYKLGRVLAVPCNSHTIDAGYVYGICSV